MARLTLTLRQKSIGGVLLVLLPLLAVDLYSLSAAYERRRTAVENSLILSAESPALFIDQALDNAVRLATLLASKTSLHSTDRELLRKELVSIRTILPDVLNLGVVGPDGTVLATALQNPVGPIGPMKVQDREVLRRALVTGEVAVSDLLIGRLTDRPTVLVAAPILEATGEVLGAAVVAIQIEAIAERIAEVQLRQDQELFLVSPDGLLAFHSGEPEIGLQQRLVRDHPLIQRAMLGEAVFEEDLSGITDERDRPGAIVKSPRYRWIVGTSWSRAKAFEALNSTLRLQIPLFTIVALGSLGGAFLVGTLLSRRVRQLGEQAKRIAGGDLQARSLLRREGGDDLDSLGRDFNRMADCLVRERRRRELFTSAVAHDMRNLMSPLTVTATALARAGAIPADQVAHFSEKLVRQVHRVERLVSDLLDLSQIEAQRFQLERGKVDLNAVLRRAVDEQPDEVRERISGEWAEVLPVQADGDRVSQVLTNLISNAAKYSPEGGPIRITTKREDGGVRVCVSDQGLGLDPEDAERIFSPWTRIDGGEQIRGIGLGLFICRSIVEAHGGRIWAESKGLGTGSSFCFTLPTP